MDDKERFIRQRIKEAQVPDILGDRIKYYRTQLGYTQSQLAGMIGVGRSYISSVEKNYKEMKLKHAVALARALQTSLDALVEGTHLTKNLEHLDLSPVIIDDDEKDEDPASR